VFPFPWVFRRLCDEYFWRVSEVQGKVSSNDSWAKKIAARAQSQLQPQPSRPDGSPSSPTPRSRSNSRDGTPEREVRTSTAPQPTSGMATPRRSRSNSRDAPPTSGRATPRRSSSRGGDVAAAATAAPSEQANREYMRFRERERERRAMAFPQSASLLLVLAMLCTATMAVWTAARYSVEFEVLHHTMWGATYGMAVLFHLVVLEPLMCIVLELRELLSSATKVLSLIRLLFAVFSRFFSQALRVKVADYNGKVEEDEKPAAAATVDSNIVGVGGSFFQRRLRAPAKEPDPVPLTARSIVPVPPARRAAPQEAASKSAVYQAQPRELDHPSDSGGWVAPPSATAAPPANAFLRRQRSGRKEDA
jgi:hypothetical protein